MRGLLCLAIILSLFLSLHPSARADLCETTFSATTSADPFASVVLSATVPVELPKKLKVSSDKKQSQHLADYAFSEYLLRDSEVELLTQALESVSKNGIDLTDHAQFDRFKDARSKTATIRGTFYVFSQSHTAPEKFDRFVIDLGHLDDLIGTKLNLLKSNPRKLDPNQLDPQIQALAAKTLASFRDAPPPADLPQFFAPGDGKNFKEFMKNSETVALDRLAQRQLKITEFHEARKELKNFMNYFEFKRDTTHSDSDKKDAKKASIYLRALIDDYGVVHDALVRAGALGTINANEYILQSDVALNAALDILKSKTRNFTDRLKIKK